MNKMLKIALVALFSILLLPSSILMPFVYATPMPTADPKEQLRMQIQNGFSNYLRERNLRFAINQSPERVFSAFLRTNPNYQEYLAEYTNLTKKDLVNRIPTAPKPSKIQVGPIFKTLNATINGTDYQLHFRHAISSDGQELTKVTFGGNGIDPEIYVAINYLTVNFWGVIITYGEIAELAIHYVTENNEALNFRNEFDLRMNEVSALNDVIWVIGSVVCAAVGGGIGGVVAGISGVISHLNIANLEDIVLNSYNEDDGLSIKLESTYIYPLFVSIFALPDFKIYAMYPSGWTLAFPTVGSYSNMYSILVLEANGWLMGNIVRSIGNYFGFNQWYLIPDPPTPPENPPPGPSGLKEVTVNGYDTTHSVSVNDANVQLDGYDIGTTGSTYTLTPETHYFETDMHASCYYGMVMFTQWELYGSNNPQSIPISTDTTITADYTPSATLEIWTEEYIPGWGYTLIDGAIYVDGNYVGYRYASVKVTANQPHTITVSFGLTFACFENNWNGIYIYSNPETITATQNQDYETVAYYLWY
jgi:hypothetical protein